MSQVQTYGHVDTALHPRTDSWISSNSLNDLVNREMNSVMASSTSSEGLLTHSHQDLHRFQSAKQPNGNGHLVLFQDVQTTSSTPSHEILSGKNMDSMVAEASFWEQLLGRGQPSTSSHPKSATQTKDGSQVVHAAIETRQPADRDPPVSNRPPTAKDWQAYRTIFTRLYKVENRTLREVMGIMKEQYHFRAR